EQRRLAGAVLAHDRPALLAAHGHREVVVHDARAVRLAQLLDLDDVITRARRHAKVEVLLDDAPRLLDLLDLVELLDAALHEVRLRGLRLEALDELALLREHRLLARVLGLAAGGLDLTRAL